MATNIEQIFRSFVVNKFKEIQEEGKLNSENSENSQNGELTAQKEENISDSTAVCLQSEGTAPTSQDETMKPENLELAKPVTIAVEAEGASKELKSSELTSDDEVKRESSKKKSKKHKKHKSKKKKKKKKKEKHEKRSKSVSSVEDQENVSSETKSVWKPAFSSPPKEQEILDALSSKTEIPNLDVQSSVNKQENISSAIEVKPAELLLDVDSGFFGPKCPIELSKNVSSNALPCAEIKEQCEPSVITTQQSNESTAHIEKTSETAKTQQSEQSLPIYSEGKSPGVNSPLDVNSEEDPLNLVNRCQSLSQPKSNCEKLQKSRSNSRHRSRSRSLVKAPESLETSTKSPKTRQRSYSISREQRKTSRSSSPDQRLRSDSRSPARRRRSRSRSSARYSKSPIRNWWSKSIRNRRRSVSVVKRHRSRTRSLARRRNSRSRSTEKRYCSRTGSRSPSRQRKSTSNSRKYRPRSKSSNKRRTRSKSANRRQSKSVSVSRIRRSRSYSGSRRRKSRSGSIARRQRSWSGLASRKQRSISGSGGRRQRSRSASVKRLKSRSVSPVRRRRSRSASLARRSRSVSPVRRRRSRSISPVRRRRSRSTSRARRRRSRSASFSRRRRSRSTSLARRRRSRSTSPAKRRRSRSASFARRRRSRSTSFTRRRRSRSSSFARRRKSRSASPVRRLRSSSLSRRRKSFERQQKSNSHSAVKRQRSRSSSASRRQSRRSTSRKGSRSISPSTTRKLSQFNTGNKSRSRSGSVILKHKSKSVERKSKSRSRSSSKLRLSELAPLNERQLTVSSTVEQTKPTSLSETITDQNKLLEKSSESLCKIETCLENNSTPVEPLSSEIAQENNACGIPLVTNQITSDSSTKAPTSNLSCIHLEPSFHEDHSTDKSNKEILTSTNISVDSCKPVDQTSLDCAETNYENLQSSPGDADILKDKIIQSSKNINQMLSEEHCDSIPKPDIVLVVEHELASTSSVREKTSPTKHKESSDVFEPTACDQYNTDNDQKFPNQTLCSDSTSLEAEGKISYLNSGSNQNSCMMTLIPAPAEAAPCSDLKYFESSSYQISKDGGFKQPDVVISPSTSSVEAPPEYAGSSTVQDSLASHSDDRIVDLNLVHVPLHNSLTNNVTSDAELKPNWILATNNTSLESSLNNQSEIQMITSKEQVPACSQVNTNSNCDLKHEDASTPTFDLPSRETVMQQNSTEASDTLFAEQSYSIMAEKAYSEQTSKDIAHDNTVESLTENSLSDAKSIDHSLSTYDNAELLTSTEREQPSNAEKYYINKEYPEVELTQAEKHMPQSCGEIGSSSSKHTSQSHDMFSNSQVESNVVSQESIQADLHVSRSFTDVTSSSSQVLEPVEHGGLDQSVHSFSGTNECVPATSDLHATIASNFGSGKEFYDGYQHCNENPETVKLENSCLNNNEINEFRNKVDSMSTSDDAEASTISVALKGLDCVVPDKEKQNLGHEAEQESVFSVTSSKMHPETSKNFGLEEKQQMLTQIGDLLSKPTVEHTDGEISSLNEQCLSLFSNSNNLNLDNIDKSTTTKTNEDIKDHGSTTYTSRDSKDGNKMIVEKHLELDIEGDSQSQKKTSSSYPALNAANLSIKHNSGSEMDVLESVPEEERNSELLQKLDKKVSLEVNSKSKAKIHEQNEHVSDTESVYVCSNVPETQNTTSDVSEMQKPPTAMPVQFKFSKTFKTLASSQLCNTSDESSDKEVSKVSSLSLSAKASASYVESSRAKAKSPQKVLQLKQLDTPLLPEVLPTESLSNVGLDGKDILQQDVVQTDDSQSSASVKHTFPHISNALSKLGVKQRQYRSRSVAQDSRSPSADRRQASRSRSKSTTRKRHSRSKSVSRKKRSQSSSRKKSSHSKSKNKRSRSKSRGRKRRSQSKSKSKKKHSPSKSSAKRKRSRSKSSERVRSVGKSEIARSKSKTRRKEVQTKSPNSSRRSRSKSTGRKSSRSKNVDVRKSSRSKSASSRSRSRSMSLSRRRLSHSKTSLQRKHSRSSSKSTSPRKRSLSRNKGRSLSRSPVRRHRSRSRSHTRRHRSRSRGRWRRSLSSSKKRSRSSSRTSGTLSTKKRRSVSKSPIRGHQSRSHAKLKDKSPVTKRKSISPIPQKKTIQSKAAACKHSIGLKSLIQKQLSQVDSQGSSGKLSKEQIPLSTIAARAQLPASSFPTRVQVSAPSINTMSQMSLPNLSEVPLPSENGNGQIPMPIVPAEQQMSVTSLAPEASLPVPDLTTATSWHVPDMASGSQWPVPDIAAGTQWSMSDLTASAQWPMADLSAGSHWPMHDLGVGTQWSVPDLAAGTPWAVPDVATGAQWTVPDLTASTQWTVPDLTAGSQWTMTNLASGAQWSVPDLAAAAQWTVPDLTSGTHIQSADLAPEAQVPGSDLATEAQVPGSDLATEAQVPGSDLTAEAQVPRSDLVSEAQVPVPDHIPDTSDNDRVSEGLNLMPDVTAEALVPVASGTLVPDVAAGIPLPDVTAAAQTPVPDVAATANMPVPDVATTAHSFMSSYGSYATVHESVFENSAKPSIYLDMSLRAGDLVDKSCVTGSRVSTKKRQSEASNRIEHQTTFESMPSTDHCLPNELPSTPATVPEISTSPSNEDISVSPECQLNSEHCIISNPPVFDPCLRSESSSLIQSTTDQCSSGLSVLFESHTNSDCQLLQASDTDSTSVNNLYANSNTSLLQESCPSPIQSYISPNHATLIDPYQSPDNNLLMEPYASPDRPILVTEYSDSNCQLLTEPDAVSECSLLTSSFASSEHSPVIKTNSSHEHSHQDLSDHHASLDCLQQQEPSTTIACSEPADCFGKSPECVNTFVSPSCQISRDRIADLDIPQLVEPYSSPEHPQLVEPYASPEQPQLVEPYASPECPRLVEPYPSPDHPLLVEPYGSPDSQEQHETNAGQEFPPVPLDSPESPQIVQSRSCAQSPLLIKQYDALDHPQLDQSFSNQDQPQFVQPNTSPKSFSSPENPPVIQSCSNLEGPLLIQPYASSDHKPDQQLANPEPIQLETLANSEHIQLLRSSTFSECPQVMQSLASSDCPQLVQPFDSPEHQQLVQPYDSPEHPQLVQPYDSLEHPQLVQPYDSPEQPQLVQPYDSPEHPQLVQPYDSPDHPQLVQLYESPEHPHLVQPCGSQKHPQKDQPCDSPKHSPLVLPFDSMECSQLIQPYATLECPQLIQPCDSPKHSQLELPHDKPEHLLLDKPYASPKHLQMEQSHESPKNKLLAQSYSSPEHPQLVQQYDSPEHLQLVQPYDSPEQLQLVQAEHPQLVETYSSSKHPQLGQPISSTVHPQLVETYSIPYHKQCDETNSSSDVSLTLESPCHDNIEKNHKQMQPLISDSKFVNSLLEDFDAKTTEPLLEVPCSSLLEMHKNSPKLSQPILEESCEHSYESEELHNAAHKSLLGGSSESPVHLAPKEDFISSDLYLSVDCNSSDSTFTSHHLKLDNCGNELSVEKSLSDKSQLQLEIQYPRDDQHEKKLDSVKIYAISDQPQIFPEQTISEEKSLSISCMNEDQFSTDQVPSNDLINVSDQPLDEENSSSSDQLLKDTCLNLQHVVYPHVSNVRPLDNLEQPSIPLLERASSNADVSLTDRIVSNLDTHFEDRAVPSVKQEEQSDRFEGDKNSGPTDQHLTDESTEIFECDSDRTAQTELLSDKAYSNPDNLPQNEPLESYRYPLSENRSSQYLQEHSVMSAKERTPWDAPEQADLDTDYSMKEHILSNPENTISELETVVEVPHLSPNQIASILPAETEETSTNLSLQTQEKVDSYMSIEASTLSVEFETHVTENFEDNVQIDQECKITPPDLLPFDSEQPTLICLNSESSCEPVLFISQPPPELLPYDTEQPANPFQNTSDYSSEQDSSVFHTPPELLPYDSDQTTILVSNSESCEEKFSSCEPTDSSDTSSAPFAASENPSISLVSPPSVEDTIKVLLSSAKEADAVIISKEFTYVEYETSGSSTLMDASDLNNSEMLIEQPAAPFLDAEIGQDLPPSTQSSFDVVEQQFVPEITTPHPLSQTEHSVEHSEVITEDSVKSEHLSTTELEQVSSVLNACDTSVVPAFDNHELENFSQQEKSTRPQSPIAMEVSKKRSRSRSLSKTELSQPLSTSKKRDSPLKCAGRSPRSRSKDRKKSRSKSTTRKKRSRSKSVTRTKKSRSKSVVKTRKSRSKSATRRKKSRSVSDTRLRRSRSRSLSKKRRSRSISLAHKRSSRSPSAAHRRSPRLSRRKRSHSTSADHKRSHSHSIARRRRSRSLSMARRRRSRSRSPVRRRRSRSPSVNRRKRSRSSSVARRRRSRSSSLTRRRRSRSSSVSRRRHSPSQLLTRRRRTPSLGRRRRSRSPSLSHRRRSRSTSHRRRSRSPSASRRRRSPSAPRRRRSPSPPRRKRSSSAARKRRSHSTSVTRKRHSRSSSASRKRRSRSSSVSRKRHSRTPSVARKRKSESKSPTPKSPKIKPRAQSKSDRSRSRSQSNIIRKRKSRSRSSSRDQSKSNEKRRKRSSSKEHYSIKQRRKSRTPPRRKKSRSPARRVSPCRSPVRRRRSRSPVRRKSFSRSPVRRKRSRSRDQSMDSARSPKRLTDLDKAQLLEIAKANAAAMCAKAGVPLPPSLKPVLTPSAPVDEKVTHRTYGVTIQELTEKCKQIAQSKEDDEVVNKPHDSDEEEDDKPFYNHPFKVSEHKPISFSLLNPSLKPAPKNQVTLTKEFPVSSGSQHRKKESDKVYGEWVPVDKKTEESKDDVFTNTGSSQPVDITAAMNERAMAQTLLSGNPFDLEALLMLNRSQEQIDAWAQSNSLPGQFTGSTGAQVLSADEISNSGPQAWLKKDQFLKAAPVTGGRGALLMRKMGWKQGEGLGRHNEGNVNPILVDFKTDRKGLVADGEKAANKLTMPVIKDLSGKHPISVLMELCNKKKWSPPDFTLVDDTGPDHRKRFLFKVTVNGVTCQPSQPSVTKKLAKATAAAAALQALGALPKESITSTTNFCSASTSTL
ncbi:protein SON [Mantella aurantiaca]